MDLDAFFAALDSVPNRRSGHFDDVDMKPTAQGYAFDGLAAPTGVASDLGEFTEEYERGMFRRFLAATTDNVPFLHEHDPRNLLATTRSGRVKLAEDGRGLRVHADVVKTPFSEGVKALVDSGDIGGMSIGMVVGRGNAKVEMRGGKPHRSVLGLRKLLDVSTTFDPAYATSEAQFRSMALQFADSSESLQQVLMGAYPQLQGQGGDPDGASEEAPAEPDESTPDGEPEPDGDRDMSGAVEQRSIAARKRELGFLILTTGGVNHET